MNRIVARYEFLPATLLSAASVLFSSPVPAEESQHPSPPAVSQEVAKEPTDQEISSPGAQEIEKTAPQSGDYWIGVQVAPVPESLLGQFGVDEARGGLIVVERIVPESPADAAGIRRGDILLRYGGQELLTFRDLVSQIAAGKKEPRQVELLRGGKKQEVDITAEERPLSLRAQTDIPNGIGGPFPGPQEFRFKIDGTDPDKMMRQMQEMMRQMQAQTQGANGIVVHPKRSDDNDSAPANEKTLDRLEVSTQAGPDGKTKINVKRIIQKGGVNDEKSWEVTHVDELPEEIRADVKAMLPKK